MLKLNRFVLPSLLLLLGLAGPVWSVGVGDPAPDFMLTTLTGDQLRLSYFKGKIPVVIYFWATWCSKCKKEMPELNRIAADFGPKGLAVLGINVGVNDSVRKAKAYREKYGLDFLIAFDTGSRVTRSYGVWGAPTILIIDRRGIVRYRGAFIPDGPEEFLDQLMK